MPVLTSTCTEWTYSSCIHKLREEANKEQLIEKLESFKGFPQEAELPSAPKQFIQYLSEDDRPQVKAGR